MFDRFIRLARARRALREGRLEDALQLAGDPLVREDRRAEEVRRAAQQQLADRGRQRLAEGDAAAAARDFERVLGAGPHPGAESALLTARQRVADAQELRLAGRRALDEARQLAERGQLAAAEAAASAAAGQPALQPAAQAVRAFVAGRRGRAGELLEQGRELLARGQVDAAVEQLRLLRALDAEVPVAWLPDLVDAAVGRLGAEVGRHLEAGDEPAALADYRRRLAQLPELWERGRVVRCGERLAAALLRRLARCERPEAEVDLVQACAAEPALPGAGPRLLAAAAALQRLPALRTGGSAADLAAALAAAGGSLGHGGLRREGEQVEARVSAVGQRLAAAREQAATGDLAAARGELLAVLAEWPLHTEARAELDAIEQGLRAREQRLHEAREAARGGRLRAAYGAALALAVPGPAGDEARALGRDLRARMDLVARGLDQVRTRLHGRETAGAAGLRHCVARLDELAKVQQDHEEIPSLRKVLQSEIAGIERHEAALAAAERGQVAPVVAALRELVSLRAGLLTPDRLDARVLDLVDRLAKAADEALAGGRLGELEQCLGGLETAVAVRADLSERVARLRAAAGAQRARAEALAAEVRELLAARDLAAAEERCEQARQLWTDAPVARKLEDEMRAIREQEAALGRVESLAAGGDLAGAQAELGTMAPTPALLRTRIFDMKQSLARAQGLENGFLLRVDEGGEFVVLRGETVTVGNLRDGSADLPVLAAIAARHARIQRSMSFHGGMQDTIVAEGGEVRVGGRAVASHRLRSGECVRLGSSMQVRYLMPSSRSLTAALQLLGGFQVAGTDRVLLLKDRGRDGRILLGPGKDVHVRVPGATGEVEIFSHRSGQVRIRCEGGGELDGRPFRDEHPVTAGAAIQAAGITLVLLPWTRSR